MVRRSSVASLDSGAESSVYGDEPVVSAEPGAQGSKAPWGGGGGRWTVWPLRVVLWAAILIIGYRGVTAIFLNETPASGNASANANSIGGTTGDQSSASTFPVTLGEAFALRFGQLYLTFSPSTATQRAQQLATFIPPSVSANDPQFGLTGTGTSTLQSLSVAGVDVRTAQTAVVTLLATRNNQLIELGVPLYSSGGGLVVSGQPALLPAPSVATLPPAQGAPADQSAEHTLANQLPDFFQAYASGDEAALGRYVVPGIPLTGLRGAVSFGSIASIYVPQGGTTRDITVTVDWILPAQVGPGAPRLATTYDMSVVDRQGARWYVEDIRASTQPMGTQ
jgi:hypothetical protein